MELKTRIICKHDTTANWNNSNLIPLKGEIIIYEDTSPQKFKIGDGVNTAKNLKFSGADLSNYIKISNTAPITDDTKLWFNTNVNEIEIPTMEDFNAFKTDLMNSITGGAW